MHDIAGVMKVSRDVVSRLTVTERRIVEYFAKHGGSAREIADALGVSERTVYKALYRYRRIARSLGVDASGFYFRNRGEVAASPVSRGKAGEEGEVVALLRRILLELERLNRNVERLCGGGRSVGGRVAERVERVEEAVSVAAEGGAGLPSFANGNPWLGVLSRRKSR